MFSFLLFLRLRWVPYQPSQSSILIRPGLADGSSCCPEQTPVPYCGQYVHPISPQSQGIMPRRQSPGRSLRLYFSISVVPLFREHRRYFYVNDRTSASQWDFPTEEDKSDDPKDSQGSKATGQGDTKTSDAGDAPGQSTLPKIFKLKMEIVNEGLRKCVLCLLTSISPFRQQHHRHPAHMPSGLHPSLLSLTAHRRPLTAPHLHLFHRAHRRLLPPLPTVMEK